MLCFKNCYDIRWLYVKMTCWWRDLPRGAFLQRGPGSAREPCFPTSGPSVSVPADQQVSLLCMECEREEEGKASNWCPVPFCLSQSGRVPQALERKHGGEKPPSSWQALENAFTWRHAGPSRSGIFPFGKKKLKHISRGIPPRLIILYNGNWELITSHNICLTSSKRVCLS